MNIVTGTGGSAWQPARLTVEAYAVADLTTPAEVLGPEVTAAEVRYGPLGAVRGMTLTLAEVPASWLASAYSRLLRVRLESEHGTGYVAIGILEQVVDGVARVIGVHEVYGGSPTRSFAALPYPPLVTTGRTYGVAVTGAPAHYTRDQLFAQLLEPFPNSEWGVGPDGVAVVGRPESATPVDLVAGAATPGLRDLGYTVTDYVTDWTIDPGNDYVTSAGGRSDVPLFVPRRAAPATGDTTTRTTSQPALAWNTPPGDFTFMGAWNGDSEPRTWLGTVNIDAIPDRYRPTRVTARVGLEIYSVTERQYDAAVPPRASQEGVVSIYLEVIAANGWKSTATLVPRRGTTAVHWAPVELPADALLGKLTLRVLIGGSQFPDTVTGRVLGGDVVVEVEQPRYAPASAADYPMGYTAPVTVGPTYEMRVPGWHVPPLRVTGLPGGRTQYAAGAVVKWQREEASTQLLTAALPYPGQRRR